MNTMMKKPNTKRRRRKNFGQNKLKIKWRRMNMFLCKGKIEGKLEGKWRKKSNKPNVYSNNKGKILINYFELKK